MSDNIIEHLKKLTTAVKEHIEMEQDRMNDPCWQLKTVYYVGQHVVDMLRDDKIEEWEIPAYAFESRQVWINKCEEEFKGDDSLIKTNQIDSSDKPYGPTNSIIVDWQ